MSHAYFALRRWLKPPLLIRSDNTTALAYARKPGRIPALAQAIEPMARHIVNHRIEASYVHLPGVENHIADSLSRSRRKDHDYSLTAEEFDRIDRSLGPHTLDLFATHYNTKLPRFCSRLPDPKATLFNAWTIGWETEHCYAFPPLPLIHRTLSHLATIQVPTDLTLVAPRWPHTIWWPKLQQMLTGPPLPLSPGSLRPGENCSHPLRSQAQLQLMAFPLSNRHLILSQSSSERQNNPKHSPAKTDSFADITLSSKKEVFRTK